MTKPQRAVQTPGDPVSQPVPPDVPEAASVPNAAEAGTPPDAFQMSAVVTGEDTASNEALLSRIAAMQEQMAQMGAAMQNLARNQASPAGKTATDAQLPDYPSEKALKAWYEQSDDVAPRLTKSGWLVHPNYGSNPNEGQNRQLTELVKLIKSKD